MLQLIILLVCVAVFFYFGMSTISYVKRRNIEKKTAIYQDLLIKARQSRMAYVKALEASENLKYQIDAISGEIGSLRIRLNQIKIELRKLLFEVHRLRAGDVMDQINRKALEKAEFELTKSLKACNSMKIPYNLKLAELRSTRAVFAKRSSETKNRSEQWLNYKEQVLNLYKELSQVIKISNPREVLLKNISE